MIATHPTLRQRHPVLFAVPRRWADLYRPRRRRCPDCRGYVWLDVDWRGRERAVCSVCGWEDECRSSRNA